MTFFQSLNLPISQSFIPRSVAIVGGGPAGCTAAILLARRGWTVTLIEQHRFPRDKVCGECLSAVGIDVLTRLGLASALATGFIESPRGRPLTPSPGTPGEGRRAGLPTPVELLTHAAIHLPACRSLRVKLPRPMWGVSRSLLDGYLLDAARAAGAIVLQPARCESVEATSDSVSPLPLLRVRDLSDNTIQ